MLIQDKPASADGQADAWVRRTVGTGTPSNLTWASLVEHEPRLNALLADAKSIKDDRSKPNFCANAAWYGYSGWAGLKRRLLFLVGWNRGMRSEGASSLEVVNLATVPVPPRVDLASLSEDEHVLQSPRAYDLAYHRIYGVLPDCRACGCM